MELLLDHADHAPVELVAEHVGEARERRVALEQRVARQLAVAVSVEERLRPCRQVIVLILERVRQLVGDTPGAPGMLSATTSRLVRGS